MTLGRTNQAFAALRVRNFRFYFAGHLVSAAGTWMQRVAQSWLVLELTGSGTAVGGVTSLQFLPILLIAPTGGLVADRVDKRKLLYLTQSLAGALAATLGLLVLLDAVQLWMVYALAFALGLVGSFDNPARKAFVVEMVGRETLSSAVGLNSVLVNTARILGPALAGVLIVTVGIGICFLLNAFSYLGVIAALALMHAAELERPPAARRGKGQLREAVGHVRGTPILRVLLVMLAVISLFAYEYEVILPLLARFTFGGDADTFGIMFAAVAAGAIAGGLHAANQGELPPETLLRHSVAFGLALALAAVAPVLWTELLALVLVGATGTSVLAISNSMLQLAATPEMQGRVIALRTTAFLGARPIGAPMVGWMGEHLGPRVAIAIGAGAVLLVTAWAGRHLRRSPAQAGDQAPIRAAPEGGTRT